MPWLKIFLDVDECVRPRETVTRAHIRPHIANKAQIMLALLHGSLTDVGELELLISKASVVFVICTQVTCAAPT